ncbi:MAG: YdcF family protein [Candidatus Rokubacteria bacterium]|nr:YdcF family protein [Candidatus Rokubacteria bacterium]
MITGRDIVCASSIDWDFLWQTHQEIMSTLARAGNRVLYIDNTGVRAPRLSDLPRIGRRLRTWWGSAHGFRMEGENLFVYSPLILPFPYSRTARLVNRLIIHRALRQWMSVMNFSAEIVWTFLPNAFALDVIKSFHPLVVVYHCADNFAKSSRGARRIGALERQVFTAADLVFVTSEELFKYAAAHSADVHLFPAGVSLAKFEKIREAPDAPRPADAPRGDRPVAGYVGALHGAKIDVELLRGLAERHPELDLLLVGPVLTDVSALRALRNVYLVGEKPHDAIPYYIRTFDVALIPYRVTDFTDNVYPVKMNEYLCMGKAVVSTPLPEVRRFGEAHPGCVAVASGAEEFGQRIAEALREDGARAQARIAAARANSWESRIAGMSALIADRLRNRSARRRLAWREAFLAQIEGPRRRLLAPALVILVVWLLLFQSPLPWMAAAPLRLEDPPVRADAILVLGAGMGESGKAGEGYQERAARAVELYRGGYAPNLVFASGYVYVFKEAEVMKALAVDLGVPAEAIVLETRAWSTYETIVLVRQILEARGWRSVLVVSAPYHMRRVSLVFRKQAPAVAVRFEPAHSHFYRHGWGASLAQLRGIAHEYLAIAYYALRGWI